MCLQMYVINVTLILFVWSLLIYIYFFQTVGVGNSTIGRLPVAVEDAYIYRDADILTVESLSGFSLRCNMKFDVCMVDVSGM